MTLLARALARAGVFAGLWFGAVMLAAAEPSKARIVSTEVIEAPSDFALSNEGDLARLAAFATRKVESMDASVQSIDRPVWIRLRIARGDLEGTEDLWLHAEADHQRSIDAFLIENGVIVERASAGFARPKSASGRLIDHLHLPLGNWTGKTAEVILRSDSVARLPFVPRLFRAEELIDYGEGRLALHMAFFGAMGFVVLIYSILFASFRDAATRDYLLFSIGLSVAMLARTGYFDLFANGRLGGFYLGDWRAEVKIINGLLGLRCLASYFELSRRLRGWATFSKVVHVLALLGCLLGPWLRPSLHIDLAGVFQSAACVVAIVLCVWTIKARLPAGVPNFVGWAGLLTGAIWNNLQMSGWVGGPDVRAIPTWSVLWLVFFSTCLLTYRFRSARDSEHAAELQRVRAERASHLLEASERANAELTRAARMKDEFLSVMSHELRTPLNAVIGYANLLQEQLVGPLNAKQSDMVRGIEESGQHLLEVVNDVLDVSRLEAGRISLDRQPVDVAALVSRSVAKLQKQADKKRITLTTQVAAALPEFSADHRRLKQILVNLLSNAVKFTPEAGRVGIDVRVDERRGKIYFEVWDTGIGIAAEDLPRLFQPFSQIESGLARRFEGTGLGLSLVRGLAKLHGGSVSVESAPGKGSRFVIELPLAA